MNKILSKLKEALPMYMLVLGIVLIYVPLPIMTIQTLIEINIGFSLCLFLYSFFKSTAIAYHFYKLVICSSVYTCGVAISTTRTILTIQTIEDHIPIVLETGQWICRENYVSGFFTTLMLFGTLLFFCKLYIQRAQNIAARFCLDIMYQKLCDIDKQVEQNHISLEERKALRQSIHNECNLYNFMDYSAKILFGNVVALGVIFIIAVVGGTAVGILDQNMHWKDALNQYIMLSSGYLVLFVIPLFLTFLGFKINKLE